MEVTLEYSKASWTLQKMPDKETFTNVSGKDALMGWDTHARETNNAEIN